MHRLDFLTLHHYDPGDTGIPVPVILSRGPSRVRILARLDTGASFCIFQRAHGEALGINIESGVRQAVATATGRFVAYGHQVSLRSLDLQVDALVYFAEGADFPRNVLGRRGWLEHLRVALVDHDGKLYVSRYDD